MVLTQEQRVELLARARAAKANKKLAEVNVEPPVEQPPTPKIKKSRKKNEEIPLPEPVKTIPESDSEEEVVAAALPAPKKKALPAKWLKAAPEPQKCCDEKVSKEEFLINDEPQVVEERIVIPAKSVIKKPRAPRASTRTLEIIAEPKPIEEVLDEVKNNDMKYRPQQKRQAPVPPPSAPIQIVKAEPALRLFDY